jgi:hypothetical protein
MMRLLAKSFMWSDKKPWWQKKAKENQTNNSHHKTWCVIQVVASAAYVNGKLCFQSEYKPCAKLNAPSKFYIEHQILSNIAIDNLTKQEAYEVAKGLNFLDRSDEWQQTK